MRSSVTEFPNAPADEERLRGFAVFRINLLKLEVVLLDPPDDGENLLVGLVDGVGAQHSRPLGTEGGSRCRDVESPEDDKTAKNFNEPSSSWFCCQTSRPVAQL